MEALYPALLKPEANGFFVEFIDLPDTFTEGATREEALANASEVLTAILEWRFDNGHEVPLPSWNRKGAHYIAPRMPKHKSLE